MKVASIHSGNSQSIAVSREPGCWQILDATKHIPWLRSTRSLIENYDRELVESELAVTTGKELSESKVEFACPLGKVEKVICVGKNYADHANEMGGEPPEIPVIFSKFPSSIIGPNEEIILPEISQKVDFEAELVVVIGKAGRFIQREVAMNHVFGYTIGNDVSARDWQKERPGGQWLLGKTFDTFAPIGPYIVTADEIADPHDLKIELKLNEQTMQAGSTSDLIFPIDFLIAHLSQFFTLHPGDLIFTGTPAGVGAGRTPPVFLQSGDQIQISISEIGTLTNQVL